MEDNNIDNRRYSPSGGAIFEMVCSVLLILFLFLPWFSIEWGDDIKYKTFWGNNPPDLVYIFTGACILNFIVKFFFRSTWLSVVVIWLAGMLIWVTNVMGEDNNIGFRVSLFIGGYLTLIIAVGMAVSILFSWINSIIHFIKNSSRKKILITIGIIFTIVLLLFALPWIIIWINDTNNYQSSIPSQPQSSEIIVNSDNEYRESKKTNSQDYYPFVENGKNGIKDASGKIIVPAKYDKADLVNNIILASKDGITYFFDGNKQIFSKGASSYNVEDQYFLATANDEDGFTMMYFPQTKTTLENIDSSSLTDYNVFLCHFSNNTYGFYSANGDIKAQGLSNDIFCLKQVSADDGGTINTYYGFCNQNDNDFFMAIYDNKGNRKCVLPIKYWQIFGIDHLTRDESEILEYQKTFTFTIDLNDFIKEHRNYIHL